MQTVRDMTFRLLSSLIKESEDEPRVLGTCPECGARGVMTERRREGAINRCANGHRHPREEFYAAEAQS